MRNVLLVLTILILASLACSESVNTGAAPVTPDDSGFNTVPPEFASPTYPEETLLPQMATPTSQFGEQGGGEEAPEGAEFGSVVWVIDGDTIDVMIDGVEYRVRYIGVNTPERDESCYQDATERNRELVEDQIVTLYKDVSETDPNGRLLRYVYVGDVFVNAVLVEEGWAEARRYQPDTAEYEYLDSLEAVAADSGWGCWSAGVFER